MFEVCARAVTEGTNVPPTTLCNERPTHPPQLRTASENRAGATADSVSSELGGYLPPVVARAPRPDGFVPVVLDSVGIRAKLSVPGIVLGGPESDASALAAARSAPLRKTRQQRLMPNCFR